MEISYTPEAIEDREFWKKSGNKTICISAILPLEHQSSLFREKRINFGFKD